MLKSWQSEGAIPGVSSAEVDSTTRQSEPRMLIADACPTGPCNNAVVRVSHSNPVSAITFSDKVLLQINKDCSLTPPSSEATSSDTSAATTKDHPCLVFVFHGASSLTACIARACRSYLQVRLHKKHISASLCGNQTVASVSRYSGSILVRYNALMLTTLSMPHADSRPLMSPRLLRALLNQQAACPA